MPRSRATCGWATEETSDRQIEPGNQRYDIEWYFTVDKIHIRQTRERQIYYSDNIMRRIIVSAVGVVGSDENLPVEGVVVRYTVCSPQMGVLRRPPTSI